MTTKEIKKDEVEEPGSVRRTCPHCHTRARMKSDRVTCPSCGKSLYRKPIIATIKKPTVSKKSEVPPNMPSENLFFIKSKRGAEATARINDDGTQVLKGSVTAPDWVTSTPEPVREKGKSLRSEKIIVGNKFAEDFTFMSPSMAAAIILGRSANGLTEWKDGNGRTLKIISVEKYSTRYEALERESELKKEYKYLLSGYEGEAR